MHFLRVACRGLLLLSCCVALHGCGKSAEVKSDPPVPVTTLQVAVRSVPFALESVGRTEGAKEVEIRARVSGIVQKQLYDEGSFVKAGAPLFQIDRAPFEIALAQARAAADQAEATNDQAKREADRVAGLLQSSAVSKRIAEEAATAYRSATASLAAARAQVREAELNLSYTSVAAPISGVTGRALHSEGSLVTANTDSSLLTRMSQTDPIWVRFALSETEHESLRRADADKSVVQLLFADGSSYAANGRVNFSGSTVDQSMGTVQLRAEFPNPKLQILPGQFTTVRVDAGQQQVIAVPQSAVLQGGQGRYVWTVGADGKAVQRAVETGSWVEQDWIISKGLNAGDTVILDNLMKLSPGAAVVAQAAAAPAVTTATAAN
jgi:membrane fusion protein, multidrug efflux system